MGAPQREEFFQMSAWVAPDQAWVARREQEITRLDAVALPHLLHKASTL